MKYPIQVGQTMFRLLDTYYVLPIIFYTIFIYGMAAFIHVEYDFTLWDTTTRTIVVGAWSMFYILLFIIKVTKAKHGSVK